MTGHYSSKAGQETEKQGEGDLGRLTTHVLDTAAGRPAGGLAVRLETAEGLKLAESRTNADGRLDHPILSGAEFKPGRYRLVFHVAEYFRACGHDLPDPPFLDEIIIGFGISDQSAHYHVPLLVSPYAYSTYRGS